MYVSFVLRLDQEKTAVMIPGGFAPRHSADRLRSGKRGFELIERINRWQARSSFADPRRRGAARVKWLRQRTRQRILSRQLERVASRRELTLEPRLPDRTSRCIPAQQHARGRLEAIFERNQQRSRPRWPLGKLATERAHCAFRGVEIARLSEPMPESDEGLCSDPIACGCGVIVRRFGPMDQLLVIVCGKKEAAVLLVLEAGEQRLRQLDCPREVLRPKRCLHQLAERSKKVRMIVKVGVEMGAAFLVRREQ